MRLRTARRRSPPNKATTHEHYIRCDNTGLRILSGDARKQWDGLIVWKGQFDERHPQEFVRGVPDNFGVKDARPESPDSVLLATGLATDQQLTGTALTLLQLDATALKYVSFLKFTITKFGLVLPVFLLSGSNVLVNGSFQVLTSGTEFVNKAGVFPLFSPGLRVETSADNAVWTPVNDVLTRITLDQSQVGQEVSIAIGRNARYVRIRLAIAPSETIEYSITASMRGGQAI